MKRKEIDLYLLNTDIEALNARYAVLYKQVKNSEDLPQPQIDRECEILLNKYNFEIRELCKLREPEYWEQQAKFKAKENEQTPWRRCWLWRLLFRPLTNRPQDIIERQAALDAEERFEPLEEDLNARTDKLYPSNEKPRHWWQRLFHKKDKPANAQTVMTVLEQSESDSTPETKEPPQPSEPSTAAPRTSDAAHQSDDKAKIIALKILSGIIEQADKASPEEAYNQPEPPAQPSEEPKKQRRRRKPEPPAVVPDQLAGQMNIDELSPEQVEERATT